MTDSKEVAVVEAVEVVPAQEMVPADSGQIAGLMEIAVRSGEDGVKALERLMDLQVRVEERDARKAFFDALAAFQEECPEIKKSGDAEIVTKGGGRYGYTYAPLEEITRTVSPILKKHGLSFNWTTEGAQNGMLDVVFILRHEGGHEERSAFPVPWGTNAAMSEAQKMGSALTYGRRQSMISGLGLTAVDDDTDGREPTDCITEKQLADLRAKIEEVGSSEARICKTYALAELGSLPKYLLAPVLDALEAKARQAKG
jgi:hypothetical protein